MVLLRAVNRNNGSSPTAHVLADAVGLQGSGPRSELLAFATFNRMIEFAEREAKAHLDFTWETVGPHYEGVRACFAPSASGLPWNQRKANLTQANLAGLDMAAGVLKRYVNEGQLAENESSELNEAIKAMEDALESEEEIADHTREVLRERLDAIKTALDEYKFWGFNGVELAFRDFAGTIATDETVRADAAESEKRQTAFWRNTAALILTFGSISGAINSTADLGKKLLPPIERMILPAPPGAPSPEPPKAVHLKTV